MSNKYKTTFTAGSSLFVKHMQLTAQLYFKLRDWKQIRQEINDNNLFLIKAKSSKLKLTCEVISRITSLNDTELELLATSSFYDSKLLCWLSICRRYDLIGEFATEVLRENYLSMVNNVTYGDFGRFIEDKSNYYPELLEIKESTLNKARQSIFKMMTEAEFISKDNEITPAFFSDEVKSVLEKNENKVFFPIK